VLPSEEITGLDDATLGLHRRQANSQACKTFYVWDEHGDGTQPLTPRTDSAIRGGRCPIAA
jgi:hypothetical protein